MNMVVFLKIEFFLEIMTNGCNRCLVQTSEILGKGGRWIQKLIEERIVVVNRNMVIRLGKPSFAG